MNFSGPSIRRPIGTLLITIGVALAGVAAFVLMPVASLPQTDLPTVTVQAQVPGASPDDMAISVAAPLEKHLGTIAGVTEMTSRSVVGSTRISLQFDLSRNIDGAARDVQAAINAARVDLPTTLKTNPTYAKVNPADAPILILALSSKSRSPTEIYDSVANIVQEQLLEVDGVGDVELGGASLPAVRVDLDPLALARYGLGLADVRTALNAANANRPRGVLESNDVSWQIYSSAPGLRAADFRDIPIAWRNGAVVRVADVGHVYDGPEDIRTMGQFDGEPAVIAVVTGQPGANIIRTVDAVKAKLPNLAAALPADVSIHVAADRTVTIRGSLHDLAATLAIAVGLVVIVVGVFLRSLRATIVPAVAVLVSLLGTAGGMYLCGFTLDNLSLMALTVATGLVVDDAIVVLENISRHAERGVPARVAALRGAREVGFTVMSISVSLVAAFIPLLFMGGLAGRLFNEFAVTMTMAVLISLVVSLTTIPMLTSLLLRKPPAAKPSRFAQFAERAFDRIQRIYAGHLDWALRHPATLAIVLVFSIAASVLLIAKAPKGLFPEQDTGSLMGNVRTDQSMSFTELQLKLKQVAGIVKSDPDVAHLVVFTGGQRAGSGFMFATLVPVSQRDSSRTIINRLRPQLAKVTGISTVLNPVQDLRAGARQSNSTYQYTLEADDPDTLRAAAAKLADLMSREPAFTDIDVDQQNGGAEIRVAVDRDISSRLGTTSQAVDETLYDGFGQRQAVTIYSGINQYHVVMGVAPEFGDSPNALGQTYVPTQASTAVTKGTANGTPNSTAVRTIVPLSEISHWTFDSAPTQVNHHDGQVAATISFNLANGHTLGEAAERLIELQTSAGLPATVHGVFAGTAKLYAQSQSSTPLLIVAALVVIYIVLGVLYESAIHPLTVISTLPSAGIGAMLALFAVGMQLDLIGLIALILLIGLVKKNAILIIDFALEAERADGLSPLEAIREASLRRFRPILMTTLAAALGALPLAIGFGNGAELRRPLGVAVIGGLVASQFLTLLCTPVVYLALDRFRRRGTRERRLARHGMTTEGSPS